MEWIEGISRAIEYIEAHLTEPMTVEKIADQALISPFYFQKGFSMICGLTVGEYIRRRRLSLAGSELASSGCKVIDIALKYGYDSPDSFAKAFTRYHGITPSAARKGNAMLKTFAPLKIKISFAGGYTMDYKIIQKDSFTVIGITGIFNYDNADQEMPEFWRQFSQQGYHQIIKSRYGISIDESMKNNTFEYMIADDYDSAKEIPFGFVTKVIPAHTWAVFSCRGALINDQSMNRVYQKIFSEWLPNCRDFDIAAGYHMEVYDNPAHYLNGVEDEQYYSEIWIPVQCVSEKKKK